VPLFGAHENSGDGRPQWDSCGPPRSKSINEGEGCRSNRSTLYPTPSLRAHYGAVRCAAKLGRGPMLAVIREQAASCSSDSGGRYVAWPETKVSNGTARVRMRGLCETVSRAETVARCILPCGRRIASGDA